MSGVPRSQRLSGGISSGQGNYAVWGTPAGTVTLIKSLYLFNGGAAAVPVNWRFHESTNGSELEVAVFNLAPSTPQRWDGWIAMNPNDYMYLFIQGATVSWWLSGAVLLGAPPYPPVERLLPIQEPHG